MAYDIFISYRREGGRDCARLIQQSLMVYGYRVFFDFDSLRDGVFNKQILSAIAEAPIFLLVLSKGSMQRCANADDWVRTEIETALKHKRKIIPLDIDRLFDGYPSELTADATSLGSILGNLQYSEMNMGQHFNASMSALINERIAPTVAPPRPGGNAVKKSSLLGKLFSPIGALLCPAGYLFKGGIAHATPIKFINYLLVMLINIVVLFIAFGLIVEVFSSLGMTNFPLATALFILASASSFIITAYKV
ncbi:MAG: toll/interleukin-1 receptor domain-containing protein [Rikenellaceae bacterium]